MQIAEQNAASDASVCAEYRVARDVLKAPIIALMLGVLALAPRVIGLADFLTTDEAYHWIRFTERFDAAISEGRWADTIFVGHPGITMFWLGRAGLVLERTARDMGWIGAPSMIEHLAWLRLPGVFLQMVFGVATWMVLRRLVDPMVALVAGFLWSTSPYLIAHGRVLHLDALLTGLLTLSLLLLLVSWRQQQAGAGGWTALLGSGALTGLALLTKGPAIIFLPFAGLMLFALAPAKDSSNRRVSGMVSEVFRRLRYAVVRYSVWLGVALGVAFAGWPALWVTPDAALQAYVGEIIFNGGRPNGDGQFFNGQAVGDPGVWFYPVASLFRTTPVMLIGLVAFVVFAMIDSRRFFTQRDAVIPVLIAFAAFWTLVMTLGPKKFDRYVLPIWPVLLVLAATGIVRGYESARAWCIRCATVVPRGGDFLKRAPLAGLLIMGAIEIGQVVWYHPYYLSYYNPLFGGGAAAQRMFLIGWGEGMDQVGAWLSSRPDIGYGPVISALRPTLQPFVPVDVRDITDLGKLPVNYAVVYLESIQRGAHPDIYRQFEPMTPIHTITIHGIEYAKIYQLPRPYRQPVGARFGDAIMLHGVSVEYDQNHLTVTPSWGALAPPQGDYVVFLQVIDAQGQRVAGVDVPPSGVGGMPTGAWLPGQQVAVPLPLSLPPDLPTGEYEVILGLYDADSGERLPVSGNFDPASTAMRAIRVATLTYP
jgi:4-amino-4-deoxy-L-arabinose transferase-like glycosyltransferase